MSPYEIFVVALFALSGVFGVLGTLALSSALERRGVEVSFFLSNNPFYLRRLYLRQDAAVRSPFLDRLSIAVNIAFVVACFTTILLVRAFVAR